MLVYVYGAVTLCGGSFQTTSASPAKRKPDPLPYISHTFQHGIRFGLFPFRSLLIGESRVWFLFLPLLRCFRSGGSRSVKELMTPKSHMRSLIRVSLVLRLLAPTQGGIAACRALLQLSSRAILQTAWRCSGQW